LEADQRAIREKQDALNLDFRRNLAKEDDARRRGDATGITAALKQQKDDQAAFDKLEMDYQKLEQERYKTAATIYQSEATAAKMPLDIFEKESNADYQRRMAGVSEKNATTNAAREKREDESKPTADDINYQRIMGKVNADPEIKALATQMKDMDPSTPEYQQYQMAIYNKMKTFFTAYPHLLPPAPMPVAPLPARPRTEFFGGTIGGRPAPTPNAVPFEALPK
jgi:hypothetical protein